MRNYSVVYIGILVLSAACGQPRHEHETDRHDHGHAGQIADHTVATVTAEQMRTIGLRLGKIEQKALTATVRVNGRVKVPNTNRAMITSLYGGVIKTLNVDVGSVVRKGEELATLVHPQFIQLQEEYLNLTRKLELAERERSRQQLLTDGNVAAQKTLQQAEYEYYQLKTRQTSLKEQLELLNVDVTTLSPTRLWSALSIRSPISGVVGTVFAKQGSYVDVSSPVAEVIENSRLHVDLEVFEKDLPRLKVGQQIHFVQTNNPEKRYDARIYAVGATFGNDSKSVPVHCTVSGDKSGLIDGMDVSAIISLAHDTSDAVPDEAVVEAEGKSYVFIAHADDHGGETQKSKEFERIEVIRGTSEMGFTAITPVRPLADDTEVVVQGAYFVNAVLSGTAGHSH